MTNTGNSNLTQKQPKKLPAEHYAGIRNIQRIKKASQYHWWQIKKPPKQHELHLPLKDIISKQVKHCSLRQVTGINQCIGIVQ